jgi:hypothetical protein
LAFFSDSLDSFYDTLTNQFWLEFGEQRELPNHEIAHRGGGVQWLRNAYKADAQHQVLRYLYPFITARRFNLPEGVPSIFVAPIRHGIVSSGASRVVRY